MYFRKEFHILSFKEYFGRQFDSLHLALRKLSYLYNIYVIMCAKIV